MFVNMCYFCEEQALLGVSSYKMCNATGGLSNHLLGLIPCTGTTQVAGLSNLVEVALCVALARRVNPAKGLT